MTLLNDTFKNLTTELVLRAVESSGLPCTGRVIPLNSMENRVFAVEIESEDARQKKQQVIGKFYRPHRWSETQLLSEHRMATLLQDEGIQTPRYILLNNSKFLIKNDISSQNSLGKIEEFYFCVWEKVFGRAPLESTQKDLFRIGRTIARMHNLFENRLTTTNFNRPSLSTAYYGREACENLKSCSQIPSPLNRVLIPLIENLVNRLSWIDTCMDFVPIHGDLHRLNLIQTENEGDFWVVDFDDCLWGAEIHDLWLLASGCNLVDARTEKPISEEALDCLLEGYSEFREMPDGSRLLIEPLRTLRMIYYVGWIAKRWPYDPLFQETFSFFTDISYWERTLADLELQRDLLASQSLLDM